jgi:outer membrane protein
MIRRIALISVACLLCVVAAYSDALAVGLEVAVGGWRQSIGGTLSYSETNIPGVIDLDNDIQFDDETKVAGRLKIDMPAFVPNIYLVAAPMEFEGTGSKSTALNFGDITFDASADLRSKITLNQYDVGLYYGLPFVKTGTLDKLNVDVGLNVRIADFKAEITGASGGVTVSESQSLTLPIPMLYVGVQFMPISALAIEAEGRGIAVGDNKLYSLTGRVRYNFAGPVFLAGGYRYDKLEIDQDDVDADIEFQGPFVELGLKF